MPSDQELFQEAIKAIQIGEEEQARHYLLTLLNQNPNHERAWLFLADLMENLDDAITCFQNALKINPRNEAAQWGLREALRRQAQNSNGHGNQTSTPVPHLGEYLIKQGLITPAQLQAALDEQAKERVRGKARMLGEILVAHGFLTREELEQAIEAQRADFFERFID